MILEPVLMIKAAEAVSVSDQDATARPRIPTPRSKPWSTTIVNDKSEDLSIAPLETRVHCRQLGGKVSAPCDVQRMDTDRCDG